MLAYLHMIGYKAELVASVKAEAVDKEIEQRMNQIGNGLTVATANQVAVVLISADHDVRKPY